MRNIAEYEIRNLLDEEKYIINLSDFSQEDKARIFLNHLLYYDFEKEYFSYLKHDEILVRLIKHPNYSPRHIEYFIKQYLNKDDNNEYDFYNSLYSYLDYPQDYWNDQFQKLNPTSQLIILILLISSDPIERNDLELTFNRTQEAARRILNKDIQPTEFDKEIKSLFKN